MPSKKKIEEIKVIKEPEKLLIENELKQDFDEYAEEANIHRAFPHLIPGFKPIAGHALWAMWVNGRRSNKPYTKSAKVEGEIMAYSPHGGCLTADTKMLLASGEIKTIKELTDAGKNEMVYSIDKNGNVIKALATNFRITKEVTELYEIIFANDFSIKATGNHKFRLINGNWIAAEDLLEGQVFDYAIFSQSDKNVHKSNSTIDIFKPSNIPTIVKIKKIKCDTTPVYDFTVNGPENALISVSEDNSLLACAHNSYGSLVRMAQDFVYHLPYIDGHGSFGSVVGGPTPGASRYTEMRLSKFTEDVLFYNTKLLDMGLNYLEEDEEPILSTWTALLPLLYITNTEGMGVPIANSWSSGNLFEFKEQLINYLETGKVDCSKVYPDFPTGGTIINKSEMKALYETGKGTIKLRGDASIEGDTIKITSLPYQVFPEDVVEGIKQYIIKNQNTVVDFANRCDKNGILIELECEPGTAEYTLEMLYKNTKLQVSIADEHKAVGPDGKVHLYNFQDYMKAFVDANINLVIKEAKYNLKEINDRLEIVDGLLSALDIIDEIIAAIKKSKSMDDAKQAILKMKRKFTERQADAIVHMPLGRLANLENIKLQDEKNELSKRKSENEKLRDDPKAQKKFFLNRFNSLIDKYAWERKTKLEDIATSMAEKPIKIEKPKQLKPKKEFMIVLTSENCLKRIDVVKFRQTEEDSKSIKVSGNQKIILVSNKGQMYKIFSNQIDKCLPTASGTSIASLRPEINDEKIMAIYSEDIELPYVYFITKNGLGKRCETKKSLLISKTVGATVCSFKSDDDELIAIKLLNDEDKIEITTNLRKEVITPDKVQARGGAGKKIIYLKKDEKILEVHSI